MKGIFRNFSFLLVLCICFSVVCVSVSAEEVLPDADTVSNDDDEPYSSYLQKHSDAVNGKQEICLTGDLATAVNAKLEANYQGKNNVLVVSDEKTAEISWTVNMPEAGLYNVNTTYFSVEGRGNNISLAVTLNGTEPYDEAGSIVLPISWKDDIEIDKAFKVDERGNDVVPERIQVPMWITTSLMDSNGYYSEALYFYFEKGENVITLKTFGDPVAFHNITLLSLNKDTVDYEEYKSQNVDKKDYAPKNYIKKIRAERPSLKSNANIFPTYEKSDISIEPFDPVSLKRNIIGTNWSSVGQYIEWEFDVPASGFYKMGVKYRQNTSEGIASLRKVYIDGNIYFEELENLEFQYTSKFKKITFGNGNEGYKFYLTEGKHTIRMEITTGKYAETIRNLDECTDRMNELYRKIIMITSKTPDIYRDYDLAAEIPELLDSLTEISSVLKKSSKELKKLCNGNIDTIDLEEAVKILDKFVDEPYSISSNLNAYSNSNSSMATFVTSLCSQPLELDYLFLASGDAEIKQDNVNFFKSIYYSFLAFLNSYTDDYDTDSLAFQDKKVIEVWASSGREPVNVLKELISSSFYKENPDVYVNLKYVHTSVIQGVLAGIEPDVLISSAGAAVVDFAMRDVLEPLNNYNGFKEAASIYRPTTLDAFVFEDKTYALPETIAFDMMFVRDDIFDELNISVPKTWREFKDVSKLILHKNMEVGIPGTPSFYYTLLLQNDYNPYRDKNTRFDVQDKVAMNVFKEWTEYYTDLSVPMFKDDLNRFRSGEMPICIMTYSFYNNLSVAAPEIRGDWSMYPLPGVVDEDGNINHSSVGSVTGAVMLKSSNQKEASWQFLKWWAGAETQSSYGKQLEYILGSSARYTAANPDSFKNLLWTNLEIVAIEEQWNCVKVMPNIPGGYYIDRNIDNAFKAAAMNNANYRETLNYWSDEINKEVIRKRKQYGLDN